MLTEKITPDTQQDSCQRKGMLVVHEQMWCKLWDKKNEFQFSKLQTERWLHNE
jgi:hypothetical protein